MCSVLNVKALVGAFNQEKALVGAFSVIVKTDCETDGSLHSSSSNDDGDSRGTYFLYLRSTSGHPDGGEDGPEECEQSRRAVCMKNALVILTMI